MSWQRRLKKGTATATRSAQLWSLNDYDFYNRINNWIKERVFEDKDYNEIFKELVQHLPEAMAHLDGFMEELVEGTPSDGISDVDWEEVARNFTEEIKEEMEAYR
ncbi:MAG TPA: hypothetical protein DCM10_00500 [Xanthomarina gelatinilytica]|nr:hypothetical protein [Xanthomarina gelatinilytica]